MIDRKLTSEIYLRAAQDCLEDLSVFAFILDKKGKVADFSTGSHYFIPGIKKDAFIGDFLLDGFEADFAKWVFECVKHGCGDGFREPFFTNILGEKAEVLCRGFLGEFCSFAVRKYKNSDKVFGQDGEDLFKLGALLQTNVGKADKEFQEVVDFVRNVWQHPDNVCVRMEIIGQSFTSKDFKQTQWGLREPIYILNSRVGEIEVFYLDKQDSDRPFLNSEKHILKALSSHLSKVVSCYLNKQENVSLIGELRSRNTKLRAMFDAVQDSVFIVDDSMKILECNTVFKRLWGASQGDICYSKIKGNNTRCHSCVVWDVFETAQVRRKEISKVFEDGQRFFEMVATPLHFNTDKVKQVIVFVKDFTPFRKAEKQIKEASLALKIQKDILERKNSALREMLVLLEQEKKSIAQRVNENISLSILPVLEKLKSDCEKKERHKMLFDLLEANFNNLLSSFGTSIGNNQFRLTAREIEICNMIKNGFFSKEIAEQLGITPRTVEIHRGNIRKKLGIIGSSQSLASFLIEL